MNFKGRIFILCGFSIKKKFDLDYIYQWTGGLNNNISWSQFLFSSKQFDDFLKCFITENVKAENKTTKLR